MAVFISYHSSKKAVAEHLAAYLARQEITTWYAPRDVPPGSNWDEAISDAVRCASALVLLFCSEADSSIHVKREIHLADQARVPIYWVRLERVHPERLGYYLAPTQWIDWLDHRDSTLDALVADLRRPSFACALGTRAGALPLPTPPIRGWPAVTVALPTERAAAEAVAHTYFRLMRDCRDASVVLPTGRAGTQVFRAMHRIVEDYGPEPFGQVRILTDTETFGVHSHHHTSRTRHVREALLDPCMVRGNGPDRAQLCLLSGHIGSHDPLLAAQHTLRQWPPILHAVSPSPTGEVLGYDVGMFTDPDDIVDDGPSVVELSEHGRRYWDPFLPSRSVVTIGMGTALQCPHLVILGFDLTKVRILRQLTHRPENPGVPASLLRRNSGAVIVTTSMIADAADLPEVQVVDTAQEGCVRIVERGSQ